jgi:hypothetical protein
MVVADSWGRTALKGWSGGWLFPLCGIVCVLAGSVVAGTRDEPTDATPPAVPPVARASWAELPPVVDGDVLGDPAWAQAEPITGFWQITPFEGRAASERTVVRILFDERHLYVGVVCYDRNPEQIIVADSRRDSPLDETDSFQFVLDTYRDRQNGFVFGTNPAGIEYDGQVTNEGQGTGFGTRQAGGAGSGFNINWDTSWTVRTQVGEFGWSAEFAVPFRSIRFRSDAEQIWGINFQRNIRRRNERAFWAPLPRQFNLYRLSLAGTLTGLDLPDRRTLQVMPYVLGEARHRRESGRTNRLGDAGVDLKYRVAPSLTLDGTYNTDFAQVEVDEQQINLDRFNLFFPEKRPFFLENAGFFAVGSPGEVDLFFSRRIGIGPDGEVVPISGGARLSGKLGDSTNVGLLNMQTREVGGVTPANNFTVVRLNRELPNRSAFGGIFVNRQAAGETAAGDDYNRTYGVDGKWGVGEFGELSGFLARTATPGFGDAQHAYRVGSRYDSQSWLLTGAYTEVGENFNPEVGFLSREGFRKMDWMVLNRYRPGEFFGLQEVRPHVSYRGYWNFEGFQETGFLHVDNHLEWRGGAEVHTGVNFTKEGVVEPFEIYPGIVVPPGTYSHKEAQLVAFTDQGAWISLRFDAYIGGFFGGDRVRSVPALRMRMGERLNTEFSLNRNDISLPGGDFTTNLARARISYSFSPRVFVQSLVQYNDRNEIWSANVRFAWLQAANTGLFVVYTDSRGFDMSEFPGERSLIVKFSKLFELGD